MTQESHHSESSTRVILIQDTKETEQNAPALQPSQCMTPQSILTTSEIISQQTTVVADRCPPVSIKAKTSYMSRDSSLELNRRAKREAVAEQSNKENVKVNADLDVVEPFEAPKFNTMPTSLTASVRQRKQDHQRASPIANYM